MQQQTVEVKEVDVLVRGIWIKKKFTDIQKGQPLRLRRTGEQRNT